MKITAEFNSNEELLSFISTFGAKDISKTVMEPIGVKEIVTTIKPEIKEAPKAKTPESKKEDVKKVQAEIVGVENKTGEVKDVEGVKEDRKEDLKVTKEMVRAMFTKIIKAGKQKEAKELTKKYGASRIPEIKEEDYEAIYKEAEELI